MKRVIAALCYGVAAGIAASQSDRVLEDGISIRSVVVVVATLTFLGAGAMLAQRREKQTRDQDGQ